MPYTPLFIIHRDSYLKELGAVQEVSDWLKFRSKWFDTKNWPQLPDRETDQHSICREGPLELEGRLWGAMGNIYDITPEARYEYHRARLKIGLPLIFPDVFLSSRTSENGWIQICPYCGISTSDLGSDVCPNCGRELLYECVSN